MECSHRREIEPPGRLRWDRATTAWVHRFFVDAAPAERAVLTGDRARQIATVLRLQPGQSIVLVTDRTEFDVVLQAVAPKLVSGRVVERRPVSTEPRFRFTLGLPLLKGDHSDEVVEAVTQLGVTRIVPFISSRSVVRELSAARLDRWRRIAREAAETAHRGALPDIESLVTWEALFDRLDGETIVCWEEAERPHLLDVVFRVALSVVIGPEGGLTPEEIELARGRGATIASLGRRKLRAETAAMAAVAAVMGAHDR